MIPFSIELKFIFHYFDLLFFLCNNMKWNITIETNIFIEMWLNLCLDFIYVFQTSNNGNGSKWIFIRKTATTNKWIANPSKDSIIIILFIWVNIRCFDRDILFGFNFRLEIVIIQFIVKFLIIKSFWIS